MKNKILKLRKEGKTYNEILKILNCSKATISYHCNRYGLGGSVKQVDNNLINKINEYYKTHSLLETANKFSLSRTTIIKYTKNKRVVLNDFERNYRTVKRNRDRRQKAKEKAVKYKGGSCEICGYNKCYWALDFHHKNSNEKEFNFSSCASFAWEKLKKEIDKCIMVCANCHREIHYKLHKQKIEKELNFK